MQAPASGGYFRWILWGVVLLQLLLICLGAVVAVRSAWPTALGVAYSVGFITGAQGITFAHDLGHSKLKFERFCAWVLMTSVCYGHFMVEHYRGHHPRTLWGSLRSAWKPYSTLQALPGPQCLLAMRVA